MKVETICVALERDFFLRNYSYKIGWFCKKFPKNEILQHILKIGLPVRYLKAVLICFEDGRRSFVVTNGGAHNW
jgi:hypothetical protein